MITLNTPFEDIHGTTHPQAVVVISSVQMTSHQTTTVSVQMKDGAPVYAAPPANSTKHINFSAWLFTSAQAMAAQKAPMPFKGHDGRDIYHVALSEDVADPVVFCEQWLLSNVINPAPAEAQQA